MTHDYKRHGTTTLFAAFDVLEGKVIGRCMQRHRHQEFIRFLNAVERQVPAGKAIHAILDNYATHKHPKVIEWLDRHPRWTFHFTPTSASWLNAVEGCVAGRWGLFGHNDRTGSMTPPPELDELLALARAIDRLRERIGDGPFQLHQEFETARGRAGQNDPGEPKQAEFWLRQLASA